MSAILSYPDYTVDASLSGGSWLGSLPLSNLRDKTLQKVSRSNGLAYANTQFQIDFTGEKSVRFLSLCAHNLQWTASFRFRFYTATVTLVHDSGSGFTNIWPNGFVDADITASPKNTTYVLPSTISCNRVIVELKDALNTQGYIDVGRCWVGGPTFAPTLNPNYGASIVYESNDVVTQALGGVQWSEKRTPRRLASVSFSGLKSADRRAALRMQQTVTTADELFFITDLSAAKEDLLYDAFPCFAKAASPITYPHYGEFETGLELIEKI